MNLVQLVSVILSIGIILIPVAGFTVRATARPIIQALADAGAFDGDPGSQASQARLSRRILELEQEVRRLKGHRNAESHLTLPVTIESAEAPSPS